MHKKCINKACGAAALAAVIGMAVCLAPQVLAGEASGWYFFHSRDGKQQPPPPELAYIEEYDGYYIDRAHPSMEDEDKVLYLTFDAGYENGNVEKILDILAEEDVPGAFFILAGLVQKDTALVQRMAAEGHLVCNHTASHRDMTSVQDLETFRGELTEMEKICRESAGVEMAKYFRPPEGKVSERSMAFAKECGYKTIFWSFAYADWDNGHQMAPEEAKRRILSETHNGEVLLLHPTSATNAAILGDLIREWKAMGFRFGTLDELCGR